MKEVLRQEIMRAELKVDIYCGKECNEHENYWNVYCEGDKDDVDEINDLILPINMPIGSKVIITAPICPECDCFQEDCDCSFNWKEWIENQYS